MTHPEPRPDLDDPEDPPPPFISDDRIRRTYSNGPRVEYERVVWARLRAGLLGGTAAAILLTHALLHFGYLAPNSELDRHALLLLAQAVGATITVVGILDLYDRRRVWTFQLGLGVMLLSWAGMWWSLVQFFSDFNALSWIIRDQPMSDLTTLTIWIAVIALIVAAAGGKYCPDLAAERPGGYAPVLLAHDVVITRLIARKLSYPLGALAIVMGVAICIVAFAVVGPFYALSGILVLVGAYRSKHRDTPGVLIAGQAALAATWTIHLLGSSSTPTGKLVGIGIVDASSALSIGAALWAYYRVRKGTTLPGS